MSLVVLLLLATGLPGGAVETGSVEDTEAKVAFFGVVMDQQEKPVANARVDIATAAPKMGPRLFCPSCYADCGKWAYTDDYGRFAITDLDPSLNFRLLCTAAGFKSWQTPLRDPLNGEVQFLLEAMPANQKYAIYSVVGDGSTQGRQLVLSTKTFTVLGDGQTRDLGLLEVSEAKTLSGRVELPGDVRLPADARIMLSRDPAWDLIAFPVEPDGSFQIMGLPPETYQVRVAATGGWELDTEKVNYQVLRASALGIHLDKSITDLVIYLRTKTP